MNGRIQTEIIASKKPEFKLPIYNHEMHSFIGKYETATLDINNHIIGEWDAEMTILPSGDAVIKGDPIDGVECYMLKYYWLDWDVEYTYVEAIDASGKKTTLRIINSEL